MKMMQQTEAWNLEAMRKETERLRQLKEEAAARELRGGASGQQ